MIYLFSCKTVNKVEIVHYFFEDSKVYHYRSKTITHVADYNKIDGSVHYNQFAGHITCDDAPNIPCGLVFEFMTQSNYLHLFEKHILLKIIENI